MKLEDETKGTVNVCLIKNVEACRKKVLKQNIAKNDKIMRQTLTVPFVSNEVDRNDFKRTKDRYMDW